MFLSGISYVLGERVQATPSVVCVRERDPTDLNFLLGQGFRNVRVSSAPPWSLAASAAQQALKKRSLSGTDVDLVVYASVSFHEFDHSRTDVSRFCAAVGANFAKTIVVTGADCANFGVALDVAKQYLAGGGVRTVLLVTTDCARPEHSRIIPPAIAILSDGAAACVLDNWSESGVRVEATSVVFNHSARLAHAENSARLVGANAVGLRACLNAVLQNTDPASIDKLIANNTSEYALKLVCKQARCPRTIVADRNIGENGHVFSADVLINLSDEMDVASLSGEAAPTWQNWLLLSQGTSVWTAALLKPVQQGRRAGG